MQPPALYAFGPFRLDLGARRLFRDGDVVPMGDRQFDVLVHLVSRAGVVNSKDALIEAAWRDVAVTDNSLEQAISGLRRVLAAAPESGVSIQTVARSGYRFVAEVERLVRRETDETLDSLLAPHRVWLEGRAALETLEAGQAMAAQRAFLRVLEASPDYAPAHIGLANALVFRFESTRADERPAVDALPPALQHAREACRLDVRSAEAWATLGFVLSRVGDQESALAAARRAVSLEPDNWRHYLRLGYVSWGEERLRAAAHTLQLLPGAGLAHWLAASVHVARQAFDAAERELDAGAAAQDEQRADVRFGAVGLHWLRGLVRLERGDEKGAREAFEQELTFESAGHLYARECCASAWYALGAIHVRHGEIGEATAAFDEAVGRASGFHTALAARAVFIKSAQAISSLESRVATLREVGARVDAALAVAVRAALSGQHAEAAAALQTALADAAPGSAGWIVPVEPALHVSAHRDTWAPVLAALRGRSA